ncbi:hypothetical protein [Streptomyces sp. 3214.6]|uniref:hypothetical protein n=1 Tax=Streptomyces sp. 3214.6 TaxID=1882757 RepID=UPI00090BF85F|nr:hypothetical protein [Streptomyces sp. 3214.6]SHH58185.1 hypothetical protein SAMN05444521_1008 [Streptomyces sp. 3214.6]
MAAQRREGPGEDGAPVPRDLPDQQADGGEDPWDAAAPESPDEAAQEVPDTDEAGTGRQGASRGGRQGASRAENGQSDHPVPDEPSA